ncbi:hypothetical protein PFISCL1PPCAC_13805, partial [Pristionchus fissidentatus]
NAPANYSQSLYGAIIPITSSVASASTPTSYTTTKNVVSREEDSSPVVFILSSRASSTTPSASSSSSLATTTTSRGTQRSSTSTTSRRTVSTTKLSSTTVGTIDPCLSVMDNAAPKVCSRLLDRRDARDPFMAMAFPNGTKPVELGWRCPSNLACCEWECCELPPAESSHRRSL